MFVTSVSMGPIELMPTIMQKSANGVNRGIHLDMERRFSYKVPAEEEHHAEGT
jgi:hypothetical protein